MALVGAVVLLAIAAIVSSGLPTAGQLGSVGLLLIMAAGAMRAAPAAQGITLSLQTAGDWVISRNGIREVAALERAHDLGFLIALHFRTGSGRRVDVALWPDSLAPDVRRQLRIWLGRERRY